MPGRIEPHTRDCPPSCGIGSNLSAMQELMASCASSARRSAAATSHGVIAWWISTANPHLELDEHFESIEGASALVCKQATAALRRRSMSLLQIS